MQKEIAVIALFAGAYILWYCFGDPVFHLDIPDRIYISQGTLDGIDIGKRISFFYKIILVAVCIFPLLYFILYKAAIYLRVRDSLLKPSACIAATGIFLILSDVAGMKHTKGIQLIWAALLLYLVCSFIGRGKGRLRLAGTAPFVAAVLMISIILLSVCFFLAGTHPLISQYPVCLFFVLSVLTGAVLLWIGKLTGYSMRRLLYLLLSFTLTPLLIFVIVEAYVYYSSQGIYIRYKWLLAGALIFSVAGGILYRLKKRRIYTTRRMLSACYAPAALATFFLFSYIPVVYQPTEIFELGNGINAVMRIFRFHEIPFLDFMSSHMLNDFFFEGVYAAIFGYNGSLDFMVYRQLYTLLCWFLIYGFLLRLFRDPAASLLFVISFPFLNILFVTFATYGLLLFFLIRRLVLRGQTTAGYIAVAAGIILLILWRLDTGSAALFTAVIYTPILFFASRERINLRICAQAAGICIVVLLCCVGLAVLLRSPDYVWQHLNSAIHYISANQAHGFSEISHTFDQQYYFYYLFVPAISLLAIFFIIYLLCGRTTVTRHPDRFILHAALFLYLFSLANFQRGLVRHGFAENTELFLVSTFFIATALMIAYSFRKQPLNRFYIAFFATSFMVIFCLKYFPLQKHDSRLEKMLSQPTLSDIAQHFSDTMVSSRTVGKNDFERNYYLELRSMLDRYLTPEQTFLDFSNAPTLYYYCQRPLPSYFCQTLQNTVDDYLQMQHLKKADTGLVPMVVYAGAPPTWFDATDDVPNVMRYYLIAEYIHRYYKPFVIVNNRRIWIARHLQLPVETYKPDTLGDRPQTYAYKKAAFFINRYFKQGKNKAVLESAGAAAPAPGHASGHNAFLIGHSLTAASGVYARICIDKPEDLKIVRVHIADDAGIMGSFTFETSSGDREYMLRLSNHYLWHVRPARYLLIEHTDGGQVQKIEFYKDNRS